VTIQVDRQVSETEKAPINNVDTKLEDKSKIEDLVVESDDARQELEAKGTMEITEDIPTQLCWSTRIKYAPVWDNDPHFLTTSYSCQKSPVDLNEPKDSALTITDPTSYQDAMSRADAIHWKQACAEELEKFVRLNLFSTVPRPVEHKVIECKWVFKTKLDKNSQVECYKARLIA